MSTPRRPGPARGKTTPASTAGSFTTYAHGAGVVDLADAIGEDDLDFARETLGPSASQNEVYDLAAQRAARDRTELAHQRDEDAFNEPLDRERLAGAWEAEAEFRRLGTGDVATVAAGDGGVWRIHVDDHDPASTAACGIIESGQYTGVRLDADGNETGDFLAEPFTDLATRGQAAAHTSDFLHRAQRATEQQAAQQAARQEPGTVDPLTAYDAARADIDHDWNLLTEGIEHLDPDTRAKRYNDIAEHFETQARRVSTHTDPRDLPGPGATALTEQMGAISAAADRAAEARRRAMSQSTGGYEIDVAGDALREKVLDTRDFTAANGVPLRARLVRRGQSYGHEGRLTATEDTVMLFDARFPDSPPMIGHEHEDRAARERNGQFVASYPVAALRAHQPGAGLHPAGNVDQSMADEETLTEVMSWVDRRAPLRQNMFAYLDSVAALDSAQATALSTNPHDDPAMSSRYQDVVDQAYATRLREITRGWDSVRRG